MSKLLTVLHNKDHSFKNFALWALIWLSLISVVLSGMIMAFKGEINSPVYFYMLSGSGLIAIVVYIASRKKLLKPLPNKIKQIIYWVGLTGRMTATLCMLYTVIVLLFGRATVFNIFPLMILVYILALAANLTVRYKEKQSSTTS